MKMQKICFLTQKQKNSICKKYAERLCEGCPLKLAKPILEDYVRCYQDLNSAHLKEICINLNVSKKALDEEIKSLNETKGQKEIEIDD